MTMTTAEYLSLPPQERWSLIETHVFGRVVGRDSWNCPHVNSFIDNRYHYLGPPRDFDEANGWWEIVLEMERKGFKYTLSDGYEGKHQCGFLKDRLISYYEHHEDRFAVQVASMRAVGFITD